MPCCIRMTRRRIWSTEQVVSLDHCMICAKDRSDHLYLMGSSAAVGQKARPSSLTRGTSYPKSLGRPKRGQRKEQCRSRGPACGQARTRTRSEACAGFVVSWHLVASNMELYSHPLSHRLLQPIFPSQGFAASLTVSGNTAEFVTRAPGQFRTWPLRWREDWIQRSAPRRYRSMSHGRRLSSTIRFI